MRHFHNSSDPQSILVAGNNDAITAESIGTVGGTSISGNAKTQVGATTGNPPLQEPYATEAASWPTSQATVSPTTPTLPTAPTIPAAGAGAGTVIPLGGCTPGGSGAKTVTLGQGTWTTSSLNSLANISKCTTAVNLSGGTYSFPAGITVPNALTVLAASNIAAGGLLSAGGTLSVQAASNIKITAGGLSTGTANISAASNIYVGGDWTSTGLVTFGGGDYSISVIGGNWSTSGGITFGSGNYTIDVTKVAGAGGAWSLGGTHAPLAPAPTTSPWTLDDWWNNLPIRAGPLKGGKLKAKLNAATTLGSGNCTSMTGDLTTSLILRW